MTRRLRDLEPDTSSEQLIFRMKELSEIVLLDFIFGQQDRVRNIDFTPYFYWVEAGKVEHKRAKHHDANFAKSTQMLEKLRHMNA